MMTLDQAIDAFVQVQRPQCDWYIKGSDYSRLGSVGFRTVDGWYSHLDAAVFILANAGTPCFLREGHVEFNQSKPFKNYPRFHYWLEIPGTFIVLDFVIAYHLLIGGHAVQRDQFHPLRLNALSGNGLVYDPCGRQYRLDASAPSNPKWV